MLKHYITYYPNTDKLKTFKQTWKGKDDRYEEYDINGELSFKQVWDGDIWVKYEYGKKGNRIYYENSDGYWSKREFDKNGEVIYFENSNGKIIDNKPKTFKPC